MKLKYKEKKHSIYIFLLTRFQPFIYQIGIVQREEMQSFPLTY